MIAQSDIHQGKGWARLSIYEYELGLEGLSALTIYLANTRCQYQLNCNDIHHIGIGKVLVWLTI